MALLLLGLGTFDLICFCPSPFLICYGSLTVNVISLRDESASLSNNGKLSSETTMNLLFLLKTRK